MGKQDFTGNQVPRGRLAPGKQLTSVFTVLASVHNVHQHKNIRLTQRDIVLAHGCGFNSPHGFCIVAMLPHSQNQKPIIYGIASNRFCVEVIASVKIDTKHFN